MKGSIYARGFLGGRETTDASLADEPSEAERTLTYQKKRLAAASEAAAPSGVRGGRGPSRPGWKGEKKDFGISKKVVSLQVEEIMGLSNKLLRDKMIYWKWVGSKVFLGFIKG